MSDLAEIERATHRVLAHYTRCIDSKNWVGLSEVFADDCVKERLGLTGRPEGVFGSMTAIARYIGDLAEFAAKA